MGDRISISLQPVKNGAYKNMLDSDSERRKIDGLHQNPPPEEYQRLWQERRNRMCTRIQALHQLSDDGAIMSLPKGMQPFGPQPCKEWLSLQKVALSPFGNNSVGVAEQK